MRAKKARPSKPERSVVASARNAPRGRKPGTARNGAQPADAGAIEVSREGECLVASLGRDSRGNRISVRMAHDLMDLAETVEDDDSIGTLAITGRGADFCVGFDSDVDPRLVETLALLSKPTVAIVNGAALDEGLELAMALDIRAAATNARFALTQLQRGILPHFGGTQRLPRLIGASHALRMILTGEPISGDAALRLGLVTYLASNPDELGRSARELLATIASRGTLGVRMVKDAVRKGVDMTLDQGIRLEEDLYALLQTSADRAEGVRAFLEKRKPLFKGA
jgi:enoyl-CoA hydratase